MAEHGEQHMGIPGYLLIFWDTFCWNNFYLRNRIG